MSDERAIRFAGLMEEYLNIPSFVCEFIEKDLKEEKYKEVIDYVIDRRNEIENKQDFITPNECIKNLQSQLQEKEKIIEDANKILKEILVIKDDDKYRPIKNTTSQEVYKTIIKLNELLKTPHRANYSILERK